MKSMGGRAYRFCDYMVRGYIAAVVLVCLALYAYLVLASIFYIPPVVTGGTAARPPSSVVGPSGCAGGMFSESFGGVLR